MLNWTISEPDWLIERKRYIPEEDGLYESLFALSNGNAGIRATVDFEAGGGRPGCFFHDLYGNGLAVRKELVNALNVSYWGLSIEGLPIHFHTVNILNFRQVLDLYKATVYLEVFFEDKLGRQTKLKVFNCLPAPHEDLLLTQFEIIPVNYSSSVQLCSGVDWKIGNGYLGGTEPSLNTTHLKIDHLNWEEKRFGISAANRSDSRLLAVAIHHNSVNGKHMVVQTNTNFSESVHFKAVQNEKCRLVRLAAFNTGKDGKQLIESCNLRVDKLIEQGTQHLLDTHQKTWVKRWEKYRVDVDGSSKDIEGFRFGIFHLIQAPGRSTEMTNIAARGLTGEYHSGHIFFNTEYYLLPYYCLFEPEVARRLILHRIKTLDAAKQHAVITGFKGARYPEEADMEGNPSAPYELKDLFTGEVSTEWSGVEVMHISADIVYAVHQYLHFTNDRSIMNEEFADFLAAVAVFCVDLLKYDKKVSAYGARKVMCFDEFHYHVDHHYATNFLCSWAIKWIVRFLTNWRKENDDLLNKDFDIGKFLENNRIDEKEMGKWVEIADSVYFPPPNSDGVIPQFEGYFELEDQPIGERGVNMLPKIMPGIRLKLDNLERCNTTLIKQADVIFLMSLFPDAFDLRTVKANFHFYEERTLHGSSLSMTPHASTAARLDLVETAYKYMLTALRYNLDFEPRYNYLNGVHLAGYAGAVTVTVIDLIGFRGEGNRLFLNPKLPGHWNQITMTIHWQSHELKFEVTKKSIRVEKLAGKEEDLFIHAFSTVRRLEQNHRAVIFKMP